MEDGRLVGDEQAVEVSSSRKSVLIGVHCSPKLSQALDNYISDQYDLMKRPEAIRKILTDWLGANEYMPKGNDVERFRAPRIK